MEEFVICCDADINFLVSEEYETEFLKNPYMEREVLGICTSSEKAKEHIRRYAKDFSDNLNLSGIAYQLSYDKAGWLANVEVKSDAPEIKVDAENIVTSNFFTFYSVSFEPDSYEGFDS